jgi:nitronate monooxygenase
MAKRFKTRITEMLGIEHPILCGGMQWVTRAEFVAQVAEAGAMGFMPAETFETPADLREEIRKIRSLTDKPFGVNVSMLPKVGDVLDRTLGFCDVICEEGVRVVETAGRNPDPILPKLKDGGVKVIHKLTSVRHAETAQRLGVDAVALLGYGSGGHIGMNNVASFIALPLAISRLEIPVIAAGGVCDGRGLLGALAMGAEAVLMGTRFMATTECPIHQAIKEKYVQAGETDTTLILSSIRNPMRCIRNKLAEDVLALESKGATLEEILAQVPGSKMKEAFSTGDADMGVLPCGQIAGLVGDIKPVKAVVEGIVAEAEELLQRLNGMVA